MGDSLLDVLADWWGIWSWQGRSCKYGRPIVKPVNQD